jgi:hypothetical protein
MGNENDSHAKIGDSLNIGAVTFAILILTIAIVTTLLNTKRLSALETQQTTELEARLISQEKISSSLKKQFENALVVLKAEMANSLQLQNEQQNLRLTKLGFQLTELETQWKADRESLLKEQNKKLIVLEAQLGTVKAELTAGLSQQNEQMVALTEEQNNKLSALKAQLELMKGEITNSLVEQNERVKALSNQLTQLESNLKVEPVISSEEPNENSAVEPETSTVEPENSTVEPENSRLEPETSALEPETSAEEVPNEQTESSN